MLSKFLSRFAALHTFCELLVLSNPRLKFHKGPTFSFVVYCCTQRQSEKVNIRNACVLPDRAKCGRFCVRGITGYFGKSWWRRISNLDLAQNLSPSTLVNFIVGRLATGRHLPMRHRTNHHNWTIETDASMHRCNIAKVFTPQRFLRFLHFVISMETGWKWTNLSMGILYPFCVIIT